jgi:tRNA (cytidine/uridine-2'-O-)-methyltransferase
MMKCVLYQPQIAPNTGNIIRLCANTGSALHLIHPLGFCWDDKRLKRAGLDHHEFVSVEHHTSLGHYHQKHHSETAGLIAIETSGETRYDHYAYRPGDSLVVGAETFGIPDTVLQSGYFRHVVYLPQRLQSRSLNMANCLAIVLYEALRQHGFPGLSP